MNKHKGRYLFHICLLGFFLTFVSSCTTVDVFERNVAIPGHEWKSDFKPEIAFEIMDTTVRYNIYIVLRHTDAYRYKNIWLKVHTQSPTGETFSQALDLKLATDDKGWLGSGMDDIFEHRIPITPPGRPEQLRAGTYRFRLENIMREDPLKHVLNAGIRIEKVPA